MNLFLLLIACWDPSQRSVEKSAVDKQQAFYLANQPVPTFKFSLERARIIELYQARQTASQTWSLWRSQTGVIEDSCPSSGYPLPYGVQLTAPEVREGVSQGAITVPQAEPNGLFTNGVTTTATWVFCIVDGAIAPTYVETHVTVYTYPIEVDYERNTIIRAGAPTLKMTK